MARRAKKTAGKIVGKKRRPRPARYFMIKCDSNGLIVGAHSSDPNLRAIVRHRRDIRLRATAEGVVVEAIRFVRRRDSRACVWKKVNGRWTCA
jgi:hypothetical protein